MFCPSCGASVQSGQKFCTSCGTALTGATAPTATPAAVEEDSNPTPPMGNPLPPPSTTTAPVTTVIATLPADQAAYHPGPAWDTVGSDWEPAVVPATQPFRITPLLAIASLAAVLAVASAFVTVAGIEIIDQTGTSTETLFKLNDFSTNLTVGAIIAALALIGGAALGATGRRVGSGLAGGAGLALAGMMGMVLGQVTDLFDTNEFTLLSSGGSFTLTTTRDIGFWLAAVAALLGAVAFVLSFESSGYDGYPPIHAAFGAVGLLGTVMAVIGPMIPLNDSNFGDQFSNDLVPPATLLLRHLVFVLIAVGGVIGFTRNRRWGLGMALGAISVATWQLLTAMTESGDLPLSYGGGNAYNGGALDANDFFAPHVVTILGIAAMVVAAAGGLIVANQQAKSV